MKSYESFRASIYPQTSKFVAKVVQDLINEKLELKFEIQDSGHRLWDEGDGKHTLSVSSVRPSLSDPELPTKGDLQRRL